MSPEVLGSHNLCVFCIGTIVGKKLKPETILEHNIPKKMLKQVLQSNSVKVGLQLFKRIRCIFFRFSFQMLHGIAHGLPHRKWSLPLKEIVLVSRTGPNEAGTNKNLVKAGPRETK